MAMLIYRCDQIRCNSLPDIFDDGPGWLDPVASLGDAAVVRLAR
ncbi:MAG: hypothetical protein ABI414_14810 [Devosia sp.]